MPKIIDHNHEAYQFMSGHLRQGEQYNGAYYYSEEIVKYFIPTIKTDYNWITINTPYCAFDHAIVFIHNNREPEKRYDWLKDYKDLILVCSQPQTIERVAYLGRTIYLPLSVDVEYVKQFKKQKKTREQAYFGRLQKRMGHYLPRETDVIGGLPRVQMLELMSKYKKVYAVGRCAIEALILGCEIGVYDDFYPDPSIWKVWDSKDAAKELQQKLNEIGAGQ